jgi:hypothetical protein
VTNALRHRTGVHVRQFWRSQIISESTDDEPDEREEEPGRDKCEPRHFVVRQALGDQEPGPLL